MIGAANAHEILAVGTQFGRVFDKNADGQYVGLSVDLLRLAAARMGDTVRFEIYPWARAQALVEQGKADILIGPYKTPEREQRFIFSDLAFYQDQMVFYVRDNALAVWRGDYAELKGKRVAAVNGWAYGGVFDHARSELDVVNIDTLQQGLQMLSAGRIDMLASNRRNTESLLTTGLELSAKVKPVEPIIDTQNGYFAFSKLGKHDQLRSRFNQVLAQMIANGELAKMAHQYGVQIP
jgi:polar amino acid transport system substrate-binding protein